VTGEILWFFGGDMGFHNVQFPVGQTYGTEGGPGYETRIIETTSGAEQRIARKSQPRHQFDAAHNVRTISDISEILTFYHARRGAAASFRYKDWGDYATTSTLCTHDGSTVSDTDAIIGNGDGSETQFQLVKSYADVGFGVTRTITLPVANSVVIALDGTSQASGWSVNDTTGIVTFSTAPTAGQQVTAGFEHDVKTRFSKEVDVDGLRRVIQAHEMHEIPSIPLVEVINETPIPDTFWHGGASPDTALTADVTITLAQGMDHTYSPASGETGHAILLPDVSTMPDGGPHFYIHNEGVESFDIEDHAAVTIVTVTASKGVICSVSRDAVGDKTWRTMKSA